MLLADKSRDGTLLEAERRLLLKTYARPTLGDSVVLAIRQSVFRESSKHRAIVSFVVKRFTYPIGYGCHTTNRIESISPSGFITYAEECAGTRPATVTDSVAPIDVPAAEAALRRPGDYVVAVIGVDHRGYVVGAYGDERMASGTELSMRSFAIAAR